MEKVPVVADGRTGTDRAPVAPVTSLVSASDVANQREFAARLLLRL